MLAAIPSNDPFSSMSQQAWCFWEDWAERIEEFFNFTWSKFQWAKTCRAISSLTSKENLILVKSIALVRTPLHLLSGNIYFILRWQTWFSWVAKVLNLPTQMKRGSVVTSFLREKNWDSFNRYLLSSLNNLWNVNISNPQKPVCRDMLCFGDQSRNWFFPVQVRGSGNCHKYWHNLNWAIWHQQPWALREWGTQLFCVFFNIRPSCCRMAGNKSILVSYMHLLCVAFVWRTRLWISGLQLLLIEKAKLVNFSVFHCLVGGLDNFSQ